MLKSRSIDRHSRGLLLAPSSVWALLTLAVVSCTCRVPFPIPNESQARFDKTVQLDTRPLKVHLVRPRVAVSKVLILYATGDGGWLGMDKQLAEWMGSWGYTVAGFSSRSYLKTLGYLPETATPRRLQLDFERIIQTAEDALSLPTDTRVILVGFSRGASFAVIAAGEPDLQSRLNGVLAMALTEKEEYVKHYRRQRVQGDGQPPKRELIEIEPYDYLQARLFALPVVIIQSTNDGYLPASQARVLFGPDNELRRLIPVDARNHSFHEGCPDLFGRMRQSLQWLDSDPARKTPLPLSSGD